MQWFPWPTQLSAGSEAETYAALSSQQRFEALALDVAAQVAHAYWTLWFIQKNQIVQRDQRTILMSFSEQVRARLESGSSGLADLAQVDLTVSRISDVIAGLQEDERAAKAELIRVIGAEAQTPTPIEPEEDPPRAWLPASSKAELKAAAIEHPRVRAQASLSEAANERARQAKGKRAPSLGVGLNWISTGPALDPSTPGSGKDAVVGLVGLSIPAWGSGYKAAVQEARGQAAAYHARERAERDRAVAELEQALANLRDAVRRVRLYETTLVPQAETTYGSTLDGYQSGRSSLADVLLAEKAFLELQLGLFRAHADHGVVWAELERIVGRTVPMQNPEDGNAP